MQKQKNPARLPKSVDELFTMQPKHEMQIGTQQQPSLLQQAFCPQADVKNGDASQNTATWD